MLSKLKEVENQVQNLYTDNSLSSRACSLSKFVFDWSHRYCEFTYPGKTEQIRILELGSSTNDHMRYCQQNFSEYILSDLNIKILESIELPPRVSILEINARCIKDKIKDDRFDRVIACNLLEHLPNPEQMIIEWLEVVKPKGFLTLLQPCDPGALWRFGRNLGPRRNAYKNGFDYDLIMALEHINPISNIITICDELCINKKNSYFPFFFKSWNFNLYYVCHIRK